MTPFVRRAGSKAAQNRIDEVCDEYEAVWLRGDRPDINLFIAQVEHELRSSLFYQLLLVELEYRQKRGESSTREEYRRDFPQFAEQIEAVGFQHGESAFATATGKTDETMRVAPRQPGSRIDHYELQERLGSGAMGEVWKAWDARLSRPVAIKLPRAPILSEGELKRFLREGRAAAQLRHPQLASIYDVGRDGHTAYIVADYVDGDNLRSYLRSRALDHREAAQMCAEVAEALHHAHELGIVHRDLKPANIIIDRTGRPHVIDFGLAKWLGEDHDLTLRGELLGTPAYMSPEQANGDSVSSGRATDVYSLGVILYEMISGRCPFVGDRGSVIHQILSRAPAPPRTLDAKVPPDLETICLKAMEKDATRRYASTQEMAVDLRRFRRGEPILARRANPLEKSWRWFRRHSAIAAAVVLAIVTLATLLMARTLVEKNFELSGYKQVTLATDPPGAKVAFAKLGDLGEFLPERVTKRDAAAEINAELLPGDYFVEALWPNGRFQQVFRRVPGSNDARGGRAPDDSRVRPRLQGGSFDWKIRADGTVVLPEITMPRDDVTADMQYVSASVENAARPPGKGHCEPFFVDVHDFSFGQSQRIFTSPPDPNHADDEPIRVSYEQAVILAELSGKRLLSSIEYQCLMDLSPQGPPGAPSLADADGFKAVNEQSVDRAHQAGHAPTARSSQVRLEPLEFLKYPSTMVDGKFRCAHSAHPRLLSND